VIKRLDLYSDSWLHTRDWPTEHQRRSDPLFSPRNPYRKIVVMVDADLLEVPAPRIPRTKAHLLSGLLQDDLVRLYRYADTGPSPEQQPRPEHPRLFDGWAVVVDPDPNQSEWAVLYSAGPKSYSQALVRGEQVDFAAADTGTVAYTDLTPRKAADQRRADGLAALVARQALGADLYITDRPYLHAVSWPLTESVTVCTVEDALPLLGLYFRAQGEFPVAYRYHFNRGLYYWVGTRELVPEAWRWFTACVQHSKGSSDDSLTILGGSLLQRVNRALEARDAIHVALNQPQNNDTQEEALSQLDGVLLNLMGAFDVAARVAHQALGLPAKDLYRVGWQNREWLDRVSAQRPQLAAIVAEGSAGGYVLTILRLLRNSVHGVALRGISVVRPGSPTESLVGLPDADATAVVSGIDAQGGRETWGVRELVPGRLHFDPGVFVDRLLKETIDLLNELLAATPVEDLPYVALSAADSAPPPPTETGPTDPFDPWVRSSIRWQLGF